ncbi:MAG: FAD-binding oxidoreductase, partial [Candidatus Puniceispirillaceae bacterium]
MDDITSFEQIIGSQNIITAEQDKIGYLEDWRGNFTGSAQAVLLPRSTEHVSQILAHADAQNQIIVTQGGNTGLVGGGIPD